MQPLAEPVACNQWLYHSHDFWASDSEPVMTASQNVDELDAVLNLETTFEDEGRAEATRAGTEAGQADGFDLGWKSGASLSAELEFMHGAAVTLLALSRKHPILIPPRALTHANELVSKSSPPLAARGNDQNLDMESYASDLRSIFRRMVALAGLPSVKYEARGSRLADLSF